MEVSPDKLSGVEWDAVIIGTGMGGGTVGLDLARRGKRVLFLERGLAYFDPKSDPIKGRFPEEDFNRTSFKGEARARLFARAGRSSEDYEDITTGKPKQFGAILGSGTGGSSALYGMVAERFFPEDFTPRSAYVDVGNSTIPEAWPVTYDEMRPWYEKAERLYRVHGSPDPLRPTESGSILPAPPLTAPNARVMEHLKSKGLNPYHLHLACDCIPECRACQSIICDRGCKNDSAKIGVVPAITQYGASLLTPCEVLGLEATRNRVTSVKARHEGRDISFHGKTIILSAGALHTPVLCLLSKSTDWTNGLANDHDQVGRNFMRHYVDMYLFTNKTKEPVAGNTKQIGVNDFYYVNGRKFGTLQSMGHIPPYKLLKNSSFGASWVLGLLGPVLSRGWRLLERNLIPLAAIMEDLPYAENRVLPHRDGFAAKGPLVNIEYHLHERERLRMKEFQAMCKNAFKPEKPAHFAFGPSNSVLGHQCGTCRFGTDPRSSVLDPNLRAWGLDNLYIIDSSVLPSSAGLNPSLTISSLALRLGEHLNDRG